jgi:hypothetical protein
LPNIDEHCKRTRLKYHTEGRDIHAWLDEPSQHYAGQHREFRHDTETVIAVGQLFGKKYGKSVAENIALDHLMADHEDEIKKRHDGTVEQEKPPQPVEMVTVAVPAKQRYRIPLMLIGAFFFVMLIGGILSLAMVISSPPPLLPDDIYMPPNTVIGFAIGAVIFSLIWVPLILISARAASSLPKYVTYPKYPAITQTTPNQSFNQNSLWYCSYCTHANAGTALNCSYCGAHRQKA